MRNITLPVHFNVHTEQYSHKYTAKICIVQHEALAYVERCTLLMSHDDSWHEVKHAFV